MSTTTSTSLMRSASSKSITAHIPASPATTSPIALPKLNLTPSNITPYKTPPPFGTPPQQPQQQPTPSSAPSTPGPWQHPRINDIIRRQSATTFDKSNVRTITTNLTLLVLTFVLTALIPTQLSKSTAPYEFYTLLPLRLLFLANMALALRPLFAKPDACEDIPLTPAQRARLGLPPMSRPATPAEEQQYVTPPRYERAGTPRGSGGSSVRAHASGSPAGGISASPMSPFASQQRRSSGSSFGTPSGTPSMLGGRRASYGVSRGSPLGGGSGEWEIGGTPSKVVGNPRASVGLNSKWLYEKGRASPNAASANGNASGGAEKGSFVSGAWGTGSVFL